MRNVSKPFAKTTHTELNTNGTGADPTGSDHRLPLGAHTNKYCVNVNLCDQYGGMKLGKSRQN